MTDADRFLQRFERDALIATAVLAAGGVAVTGGDPWAGAAVAAGGLLAGISYRSLKGGVGALGAGARPWPLVKFFTRYGILAFAAYVMLVRLRLHPLGVLAGVSSPVVAAMVAAARSLRPVTRSGHHQGTDPR